MNRSVTFLGIDGFPALLLVSVWYSGPLYIWGDVSCHDIIVCVCVGDAGGAPWNTRL